MKQKLLKILLLMSCVWLWGTISAAATVVLKQEVERKSVASVLHNSRSIREIRQLSDLERPSTSAQQLLVQSPTPSPGRATQVIPITSVKANRTDKGVEVILETPQGTQLQVTNRSVGNNFIVDVSGGQLRLPSGEAFTFPSEKPSAGITESDNYSGQIDLLGKFKTGLIAHQLLVGFDFTLGVNDGQRSTATLPLLDIFDPDYNILEPDFPLAPKGEGYTRNYGVSLQDQIAFSDNFKLLIGGRYDWALSVYEEAGAQFTTEGEAFSPRIGLVYQPIEPVSLYASYSRSFVPNSGRSRDNELFAPSRGTQYEIGVRGEFLDGRLSTNLAAYHLTKTNVTTFDLDNPGFSILTGEQRSQGIELDVSGEILPGLKVIASYAYTDAEVTKDNDIPVGNRLLNVPEHQASLWIALVGLRTDEPFY